MNLYRRTSITPRCTPLWDISILETACDLQLGFRRSYTFLDLCYRLGINYPVLIDIKYAERRRETLGEMIPRSRNIEKDPKGTVATYAQVQQINWTFFDSPHMCQLSPTNQKQLKLQGCTSRGDVHLALGLGLSLSRYIYAICASTALKRRPLFLKSHSEVSRVLVGCLNDSRRIIIGLGRYHIWKSVAGSGS